MPGWIKIHRQFLDHWLCNEYRPLTKREAWENMLLWANYAEVDVLIKGQVIKCGRGQLVYSLETLSEKFNWSVGATRHFLKLLQKDNMILVEGLKYTTRITICNYSIGKERAAAGKLLKVYKDKYPKATSDEIIKSLRQYFNQCVAINDTWLKSNMSLPIIIDKFNQINHILKNGSQKLKFTEADFK